jgi:nitrite reductase (NO-forming)
MDTDHQPSAPDRSTPHQVGAGHPLPGQQSSALRRAGLAVVGVVVVVAVTIAALLVWPPGEAGQPGAPTGGPASPVAPTGEVTRVSIEARGMAFFPSTIEVPAGNRLEVRFVNADNQRHDLVFATGAASAVVAPGAQQVIDVGVISADLLGWCSLPGHRAMGMELVVVATGAPTDPGQAGPATSPADSALVKAPTMAELNRQAGLEPAYPAVVGPVEPGREHSYTFTVTESTQPVADGLTRAVWTYNGTSPGPVLHGRVGDTFHIRLVNAGTMGHSIDFHAGELAPDQPMRTIEPGQSLEYTFTAHRSGIWMYHCSTVPMSNHIANGMFGAVIIEPEGLPAVDQQYVLIHSEMYLGAEAGPADPAKVAAGIPDVAAFNGRAFQYDAHPLTARTGQRVRFWVLNVGPNSSLAFHVVGAQFDTVWTEGAYTVERGASTDGRTAGVTGAQVLPLLAAQGGFVELVPAEAGHYPVVNHLMSLAEKGAHATLEVTD